MTSTTKEASSSSSRTNRVMNGGNEADGIRFNNSIPSPPEDAPTPIISNRAFLTDSPRNPPPMTLPPLRHSCLEEDVSLVARFSSLDEEPIVMKRNALVSIGDGRTNQRQPRRPRKQNVESTAGIQQFISLTPPSMSYVGLAQCAVAQFRQVKYKRDQSQSQSQSDTSVPRTGFGIMSSPHHQPTGALDFFFHNQTATAATAPVAEGMRFVRGIPNHGQTCFLNSVLQSLASLEPFMAYLERLVEVNQDRYEFFHKEALLIDPDNDMVAAAAAALPSNKEDTLSFSSENWQPTKPDASLTLMLLDMLRDINGYTTANDRRIDTRPLLVAIGQKHSQFRAKHGSGYASIGKEQQDAEELLQAVFGIVVDEAQFELQHSSVPTTFVSSLSNSDNISVAGGDGKEGEVLTIGSVLKMAQKQKITKPDPASISKNHMAPSTIFERESSGTSDSEKSTSLNTSSDGTESPTTQREEKKQEEFEVYVPRVHSEENMLDGNNATAPLEQVVDRPGFHHNSDLDSISDMSLREHNNRLSASMQIVMSTTSSISPSPLCAWIGSALQCRACRHVRPIQNSPLFDIPVIPTAVSNYLSTSARRAAARGPPEKCDPSHPGRPCTLQECLEEFTAIERVHDVECRNCTLRREKDILEEEVAVLREAVDGLSRVGRVKRSQNNMDDLKDLLYDLQQAEAKLSAVSLASPDDDEPLEEILQSGDMDVMYDRKVEIERHDSFKCLLLTRLPSILTIHVQRRFYDPLTNRMSKTSQHVRFPEFLDVAPYCAYGGDVTPGFQWAGTPSRKKPSGVRRPIHYRLLSVIEHRGGAFYGHYVCFRRDPTSGRWLFISDNIVRTVDWEDVCQCQAYMLFYEAISSC